MADHITDLYVSHCEAEEKNLQSRGFQKVNVDLNKGVGGNFIYIWYRKQSGQAPISKIQQWDGSWLGQGRLHQDR